MRVYASVFVYSVTIWLHLNNLTAENVNAVVIKEPVPQSVCLTDSNVPKHATLANGVCVNNEDEPEAEVTRLSVLKCSREKSGHKNRM